MSGHCAFGEGGVAQHVITLTWALPSIQLMNCVTLSW